MNYKYFYVVPIAAVISFLFLSMNKLGPSASKVLHENCTNAIDHFQNIEQMKEKLLKKFYIEEVSEEKAGIKTIYFKTSIIPFDFNMCGVEFDSNTKKIIKSWYKSD